MNTKPVERVYLDDVRLKPQTIAHHLARYEFAAATMHPKGAIALDLACGSGYGTDIMRKAGYIATGVDLSDVAIAYAARKYPGNNYLLADVIDFKYPESDLITFFEAIEHVEYWQGIRVLQKAKEALKPGGRFLLSVPRDTNRKYNGFHVSDWDYHFLETILSKIFKDVVIIGQDWDTAKFEETNVADNDFYIAICKNL